MARGAYFSKVNVSQTRPQGKPVINKHLQSPDGKSSMQINTNVSLKAPATPGWQQQRAQQIQATAKRRCQEQHANRYKPFTTSTCKAPMARAARK